MCVLCSLHFVHSERILCTRIIINVLGGGTYEIIPRGIITHAYAIQIGINLLTLLWMSQVLEADATRCANVSERWLLDAVSKTRIAHRHGQRSNR